MLSDWGRMIRPKGQACPGTSGGFQAHAGGVKSPFLQFHKNTGARLGVAQGLMMVQLYLKVAADMVKGFGSWRKAAAGPLEGIVKGKTGIRAAKGFAAAVEDAPVEGGVMGDKTGGPIHEGGHFGPDFWKCGGIPEIFPREPVYPGKKNHR